MGRLSGKGAVITGAASGIGAAAARLFAAEGAALVLADLEPPEGPEWVRCDVSRAADVDRLRDAALARLDRVDVVFANAGLTAGGDTIETSEADWDRVIDVDLKGVWLTCKAFLPHMVEHGGGSIVATASQLGLVGLAGSGPYTAAKAGVINLVRTIAAEYGKRGIRANALCPGPTDTPLTRRFAGREAVVASTLLGRIGEPEEIAYAALFLAGDESSYVTGAALVVDGGYTAV